MAKLVHPRVENAGLAEFCDPVRTTRMARKADKTSPTKKKPSPLVAAISAALLKGASKQSGKAAPRGAKPPARRDKRG